ncbi:hypothetical protein H1R20_g1547, partial [Candolleomyces eurysporus]
MFTTRFLHVLLLSSLAVAWVELDPAIIPALDEPLEVYSLGDPSFLPHEWLEQIVGNVAHGVKLTKRQDDSEYRSYVHYNVSPPFAENLVSLHSGLKGFEPPADDTHTQLTQGPNLGGNTANDIAEAGNLSRRWNDEKPDSIYLTTGFFKRWIECGGKKFPVCGPGSRASFGVGAGNKIFSLSYRWKPAKKSGKKIKACHAEKVAQAIKKALEGKGRVKVKHVDTCYYDSGAQYIQPVYRVLGESFPEDNHDNATESSEILRFFPIGDEPVENVLPGGAAAASEGQPGPAEPKENQHTEVARSLKRNYFEARTSLYERSGKPTITVGRYVTQKDIHEVEFLANANGFWNSLASSTSINFVNSQYYWAPSWIYGSGARWYVNSVNLALTEAHGWKHLFSTWQGSPNIDPVRIPSTLPTDGYGPGPNNLGLAYWIIDAGEVIPAPIDFPSDPAQAFKPWWRVFCGGLHAVLGWRTKTLFADDVAVNMAKAIAIKRPVASAWLDAALHDSAYASGLKFNGRPYGRASVIYPCGRGSDQVTQVQKLGKPTCLTMQWWYDN